MVKQYPHSISITLSNTPVQDEQSGNFTVSESGSLFTGKCRAQKVKSNDIVRGADGAIIECSYVVFLPKLSFLVPFGSAVQVNFKNSVFQGNVKSQFDGQFNSRLWV